MEHETRSDHKQVKPKIVILGAGFGGLYTFLKLRKTLGAGDADITIINKTNYFLFTPLLHEVATGGLAHHQVVESVRSVTWKYGATVHVAEVKRVDTTGKLVETTVGNFAYDILVIATGSSPEFYGIPGAAERALPLKTLRDAIAMRNRFMDAFEKAVETKDVAERKRLLTFVVVGGGATGVELAAEMAELFRDTYYKFLCGKIPREEVSIELIASEPELLMVFHEKIREHSKEILTNLTVNVHTNTRVTGVDTKGVMLADGSRIEAEHILWTAGVHPNVPAADIELPTIPKGQRGAGRLIIDRQMQVKGLPDVYALGDVATFEDEGLPMHAQMAVQAARTVAHNIVVDVYERNGDKSFSKKDFVYKPVGDLVSLGQWSAAGYIDRVLLTGPIAWFIWRTVYLFKFASWPKRIKIAVDWTIDIFYPRDITRA